MKILLIHVSVPETEEIGKKQRKILFPSLTLAYVAALFPKNWDITLCDNAINHIPFDDDFDLVGITFYGTTAAHAFTIAECFRTRGIKVLFGGPTVTISPEICLSYCDSLIIGEAEDIIANIVADLETGKLAPRYSAGTLVELSNLPVPRYDLLDFTRYMGAYPVQTARGCVFQCSFCTVPILNNHTIRYIPISNVVRDVKEAMIHSKSQKIFFVDDNINMKPDRAIELFNALKPLNIEWYGFSTWLIGMQPKVLKAAADSGCRILFIGFESLNKIELSAINKSFNNPDNYRKAIERIHSFGIHIMPSFIVGLDGDDNEVFKRTFDFIYSSRLSLPVVHLFTPIPGTPIYERFLIEGRLTESDLKLFDCKHVVFRPDGMNSEELKRGYSGLIHSLYSPSSVLYRTVFRKPIGGWRRVGMQLRVIIINIFWMISILPSKMRRVLSRWHELAWKAK